MAPKSRGEPPADPASELSTDEVSRIVHSAYLRHQIRGREIAEAEARLSRWFWEDDEEGGDGHEA